MAAAPSIGRAAAVEAPPRAPEVELTQALYERYSHQLYGYCFAKLGSREEAEDAVQTTFLNAFRALERGVVPQTESAWLFKIAENVCLSRHRSSFRRRRVESPSDLEVLQDVVPAREHGGDELVGLERVLEQMPPGQRRAILLREWQGLSYREIADELQLTQAAVETLIFRARRSLAQGLESLDDWERKPLRRRVRRGAHAGGLIAALKTFLGTAAGMKAAATVAAVGSATVIAATPPSLRQVLTGRVQRVGQQAPAVKYHHPAAVAAVAVAAASAPSAGPAGVAGAGPVTPAATRAASPTHPFALALLVSHRSAAPVRPGAPVEGAAVAAPMSAPVPAPSAAAPVAVVPAAPAPVEVAPVPQPQPVQAPAPPPAVQPRDGAPAPPVAAPQQQLVSAPAKEKGHDNGQQGQAAPGGLPSGHDGTGDNGQGGQKTDARAIAIVSVPAETTSPSAPTSPVAPPSAPAATTTSGAAPAPAAAPAAPADRGHRGDGHGGGNGGGGGGDGNAHGNGGGDANRQAGSSGSGNGNGNGSDNQR